MQGIEFLIFVLNSILMFVELNNRKADKILHFCDYCETVAPISEACLIALFTFECLSSTILRHTQHKVLQAITSHRQF